MSPKRDNDRMSISYARRAEGRVVNLTLEKKKKNMWAVEDCTARVRQSPDLLGSPTLRVVFNE